MGEESMTQDTIHVIIAVFDTQTGAELARQALKASRDEELIRMGGSTSSLPP
jgi:uncharacterized membrane protein